MDLSNLIVSTAMIEGGIEISKPQLIERLLQQLASEGLVNAEDFADIFASIVKRETLATTGIGNGVAIPHTKHSSVTHPIVLLARCRHPVNFESLDGEPADILALYLAPRDSSRARETLRASELLLRKLANKEFCHQIRQAQSPEEIVDVLKEAESCG
jgi:PTS system nitrogen regulatory IIA component